MDAQITEAAVTLIAAMLTKYSLNAIKAWWPDLEGKKVIALTVPVALVISIPALVYMGVNPRAALLFAMLSALSATGFNEATKPSNGPVVGGGEDETGNPPPPVPQG